MKAYCEKPDKSYEWVEMGEPVCGEDFCDSCGDCLACQWHGPEDYCNSIGSFWVIYLHDDKNPFKPKPEQEES